MSKLWRRVGVRLAAATLAFALAFGAAGCGNDDDADGRYAPPPTPTPTSGQRTVDIYDGRHPDINVYAGSSVRWRNLGDLAHTVTARDGSFDTGVVEEGRRTGYIVFSTIGEIEYYDRLNPGMSGTIRVFERR